MSDTRDEVKRRFGASAENYVRSKDHAQGESLDRLIEVTAPRSEWRALDVATGGGHTALALSPLVREVVATDLTAPMLAAAERFIREKGVANVRFQEADAGALPFEDASFDLATCRIAAHHFPDIAAFVREAARVVRPGGLVAVIDNVVPEDPEAAAAINAWEKARDPSHDRALPASEWRQLFQRAGLAIEHDEAFRKARDFEAWIGRMPVDAATKERVRAMLTDSRGGMREFLRPEGEDGALRFYLEEILVIGRRS
ncbi:MAG TPA: methyltransferase domain-containing protein [Candidatus Eisenbacteria bacterium]|nr:methyltransferase domain-containing protein [Candidatus Eisenbacteria bacterium]